ncbi:hypothetical protein K470DRAFT_266828 [Piedraia hortae CBS 480.64]|uniref:Uncharacterized protein n=1 Tax=Piedraia hortae CBS 480.64 TaxID=1314780 RepID=A0A6A7BQ52_9PEZI|nr:hypothetical protein K470DRAFT_266828 [Piedraia hortae CBS 480.64]
MVEHGAVLGGYQATAYFYPIVRITSAPWDFYCCSTECDPDSFVGTMRQITMLELIEDVRSDENRRVVYMRGHMNGLNDPITVRISVSSSDPMASIMDLKMSYQHSAISAYGAICFWPKLGGKKQYRVFKHNGGQASYPRGKTVCAVELSSLAEERPRHHTPHPSIYSAGQKGVELVSFRNVIGVPEDAFRKRYCFLENVVYAVHVL